MSLSRLTIFTLSCATFPAGCSGKGDGSNSVWRVSYVGQ